jgi:hypothetical protein
VDIANYGIVKDRIADLFVKDIDQAEKSTLGDLNNDDVGLACGLAVALQSGRVVADYMREIARVDDEISAMDGADIEPLVVGEKFGLPNQPTKIGDAATH